MTSRADFPIPMQPAGDMGPCVVLIPAPGAYDRETESQATKIADAIGYPVFYTLSDGHERAVSPLAGRCYIVQ